MIGNTPKVVPLPVYFHERRVQKQRQRFTDRTVCALL
jgi:hypothetical protein